MIKFLKLNLAVEIDTATNDDGKGVWRATCKSLNLSADGQSPDDALRILREAILNAERVAANDLRVAVFNSKKNEAEIVEERADVKREEEKKEEEEVVSDALDTSTTGGRWDSAGEGGRVDRLPRKRGRPKKVREGEDESRADETVS